MRRVEIREQIVQFFENLYYSENIIRPTLDSNDFPLIQEHSWNGWKGFRGRRRWQRSPVECAGDEAAGLGVFNFTLLSVHMECF